MESKLMSKVFGWMCGGLLITFLTGFLVSNYEYTAVKLMTGPAYIIFALIEIGLVIFLSARLTKMSPTTARITFLLYSIVSGLTFSSIFLVYEISSVIYVFLITSVIFGILAFIGSTTKMDLMKIGTYLFAALIALLLCTVLNIFIKSTSFDFLLTIGFIVIFIGMTAFDVQKIKRQAEMGIIPEENLAIYGALELYLDFINLFIELLKIFGKRDD